MKAVLSLVGLLCVLSFAAANIRFPDLPRTYFVSVVENSQNETVFSPSEVEMHIGDRIQWKWANLDEGINIVQFNSTAPASNPFNSGDLETSGGFYWYPSLVGDYFYVSESNPSVMQGHINVGIAQNYSENYDGPSAGNKQVVGGSVLLALLAAFL